MNQNLKIRKEGNSGITLIALIVTIIVLIILAGITINLLMGDNGILTRANGAKKLNEEAELQEKLNMEYAAYLMEEAKGTELTFAEYLVQQGYDVSYTNDGHTTAEILVDGKIYTLSAKGEAEYLGEVGKTKPRMPGLEATVGTDSVSISVNREENTKYTYTIKKSSDNTVVGESNSKIVDNTYEFNNLTSGETYIVTIEAENDYGTTTKNVTIKMKTFEELTQGKANFVITPYVENSEWQEKVKVTIQNNYETTDSNIRLEYSVGNTTNFQAYPEGGFDVNKNTKLYGRFYNTVTQEVGYAFTDEVEVIDNIKPTVTISLTDLQTTTITVTVTVTDNYAMPDTSSYTYYIGTSNENYTLQTPVTQEGNSYTYSGLTPGLMYYIKVEVDDKCGNTGKNEINVQTIEAVTINDVTLNYSNTTMGLANDLQLSANINSSNNNKVNTTWTSSNTSVATVSNTGLVTAKQKGTAIINCTVTGDNTVSKNCNIEVVEYGYSNIESASWDSYNDSCIGLNAIDGLFTTGNGHNWYGGTKLLISYKEIFDINTIGVYTTSNWGNSFSSATIYYSEDDSLTLNSDLSQFSSVTVTTESDCALSSTIRAKRVLLTKSETGAVYEFRCIPKITLNATKINLEKNETYQLVATIGDNNTIYEDAEYTSSNTSIATVSDSGLITAIQPGTAIVNCKGAICEVTVQAYKNIKNAWWDNAFENNVGTNAIDGSFTTGNGHNWYGGTKLLISYKEIFDINTIGVYTTSNWGNSFSSATIYYSEDDSLTLNSDLSQFSSVTVTTESDCALSSTIRAKRVLLTKSETGAVYEFRCLFK